MDTVFGDNWVMYADCEVAYNGAALAHLRRGNYLIIKKRDGSVSIQGGDLNQPRNYIRSTSVEIHNNIIVCQNKREWLKIKIHNHWWMKNTEQWDAHKVELYRTEQQLVDKLLRCLGELLPEAIGGEIIREYRIPEAGAIDVGIFKPHTSWLVEVKRKKVTLQTIGQVLKYRDHYSEQHAPHLVIVAPDISPNGLKYAQSHNIRFIQLVWDDVPTAFNELLSAVQ